MKELIIYLTFCAASIMAIYIVYHQVTQDDEAQGDD